MNILDDLIPEPGSFYIMDRGYLDFARLYILTQFFAFFVIRSKANLKFRRLYSHPIDKDTGLRCDQTIALTGIKSAKGYPDKLRRTRYFDIETNLDLTFLSNNFFIPALTIAQLYKCRWQVELFFKWIKQHLRIKAFFGTSKNAVKTQIGIAISVYVLVAIIKKRLNLDPGVMDLHMEIQRVFDWDNHHMFSFFMSDQLWDKDNEYAANPLGEHMVSGFGDRSKPAGETEIGDLSLQRVKDGKEILSPFFGKQRSKNNR